MGNALFDLGRYAEAVPLILKVWSDKRRDWFWRSRADNLLVYISQKTGLPKGTHRMSDAVTGTQKAGGNASDLFEALIDKVAVRWSRSSRSSGRST